MSDPWRPWEKLRRPKPAEIVPYTGEFFSEAEEQQLRAAFSRGKPVPAFSRRVSYGGQGTIHRTGTIDIQVNWKTREVKAVWFRCLNLPFTVSEVEPGDPAQYVINPDSVAIEEITYADLREESSQ